MVGTAEAQQEREVRFFLPRQRVSGIHKPMARPPLPPSQRRSKVIPVRFTAGELAALREKARRAGTTVAELLRRSALGSPTEKNQLPGIADGRRKRKKERK